MRTVLDERREAVVVAGAAATAVVVGLLVARSPLLAVLAIAACGVAVGALRFGLLALAVPALMLLPWFVVMEGVAPPLVGTLTAAAGAGSLLLYVTPLRFESRLVPAAALVFVVVVLVNAILATDPEQLIQAAKYLVFVAVAVAVSSTGAAELMPRLKAPLLGSCLAAMAVHLLLIAAGVGSSSTYYGVGEELGLAADGPHALALLATIVAAAGLTVRRIELQIAFFSLGLVPAMLTGVRSALLGIAVVLGVFLWRSPSKVRAIAVLAALAGIAVLTGAADVVTSRFDREAGEFATFAGAGSDRGLIWTVALDGWEASGVGAWAFGAGLRSVAGFEVAALGSALIGHSDFIEVLVQLGVLGLIAWLAIWVGLLRARLSPLVLLPIAAFGVVNGSLEYVAALTIGLCLAAACADRRRGSPPAPRSAG